MSKIEASDIRVQDLDHCGLIDGICDRMGLVEQLDRLLGTHPPEIVTPGQAVKAPIAIERGVKVTGQNIVLNFGRNSGDQIAIALAIPLSAR